MNRRLLLKMLSLLPFVGVAQAAMPQPRLGAAELLPATLDPRVATAVANVVDALWPMPEGFFVASERGHIIVQNHQLGFAISPLQIEDGVAVDIAKKTFPMLLSAIEQYHSNI